MAAFSVLVVDDEVDFLRTIVHRLQKRKLDVMGVPSGEEALELLERKTFDVILLDIKMPGRVDGIETLREIKMRQPLIEVILLTGHATVESSIEGMKLGAFDYLLKPIKFEELLIKIAAALEKNAVHEGKIFAAKLKELRFPGESEAG
ncbi:MAG TPA: response regulator [Desulfobacterales bacterium]